MKKWVLLPVEIDTDTTSEADLKIYENSGNLFESEFDAFIDLRYFFGERRTRTMFHQIHFFDYHKKKHMQKLMMPVAPRCPGYDDT